MLRPTQDLWKKESETLNFRIGKKNLNFMQVKGEKETQRVILLGVGLEDLPVDRLEVRMMLDLCFNFLARDKIFLSQKFVLISSFSSLSLDDFSPARI